MKYAVRMTSAAARRFGLGKKVWVKDRDDDVLVGLKDRGLWDTYDEAKKHSLCGDEIIVEVHEE